MWMKKSLQFVFLAAAAIAVVAEPPVYGAPAFTPSIRTAGHVGYQTGYQTGYQGGYNVGYQGGYQSGYSGYQSGYSNKQYGGYENMAPRPFNFQYEVKDAQSGNDYAHHATSDGRSVQGEYQVLLPDGRRQIVKYTADDNGYNADVRYEGQAKQYQGGYQSGGYTGYTPQASYGGQRAGYSGYSVPRPVYGPFAR